LDEEEGGRWTVVDTSEVGGGGESPSRERESREKKVRAEEERSRMLSLPTGRANRSGATESCHLLWRD
jgi:hypothetical protein